MQELEYVVVDVFADSALNGNPLAVVPNAFGLTTERMLAIAREFNLSETTFVERRSKTEEQAEGVRVRIFTTQEELPFAGHPTLGTAAVLKMTAPETMRGDTVTLAFRVGAIPVRFEAESGAALFGEMTQRDPEFGAGLDPAEVARLTGLELDDLDRSVQPQVVSTGTAFAIVLLRRPEAIGRLKVKQDEAMAYLRRQAARWFYVLAPSHAQGESGTNRFRARMQFYGGEDPATGSAAGCAISYLVARNIVKSGELAHFHQGIEIGRPSELQVSAQWKSARVTDVRVGGRTVLVAKGKLFLP